ncbi:MAG: response regulator [Betaproteobacteria bacterium]|nr:response regulator [Pseudomonadota bacterium]NBP37195.1 response regulator [Betaproteobacteria bacterium]NBT70965.1 response regulator [Betaproteobacteria bacterium]NCV12859.1 response regulator [Betaproteobacteria bacterium]NCW81647.1 response regulator [Betaproteobacteria bacterium]
MQGPHRPSKHQQLVEAQRYHYAWRSFPLFVMALMAGSILELASAWQPSTALQAAVWSGFASACLLWAIWLLRVRSQSNQESDDDQAARLKEEKRLQQLLLAVGSLIGLGWIGLFPASERHAVSFVLFHTGYLLISLLCLGSLKRLFLIATVPALLPIPAVIIFYQDLLGIPLQAAMILIPMVMLGFQQRLETMITELLELRFSHLDLLHDLQAQRDAAHQANLAKSSFLATASHDLRQPMHSLNLYLASTAAYPLTDDLRDMVKRMQQCAGYMNEMFDSLLDIARLDAQVIAPRIESVSLQSILLRLQSEFQTIADARAIELRFSATPSLAVLSDAGMLERILRNLISNALKYTKIGTVQVIVKQRGSRIRIAVIDSGPGIPRALRRRVFEEFARVRDDGLAEGPRGFGLGLAIARRLADTLKIGLRLRSSAFRGSSFCIDMPVAPFAQLKLALDAGDPPATLEGQLVLVVDDDLEVLTAMTLMLTLHGCRILAAGGFQEALQQCERMQNKPSLLVCDYALGHEKDGLQLIEHIREEFNHDIPAVLITGDTSPKHVALFARSGVEVLHKPVHPDTMIQAMRRSLQQVRRENESAGATANMQP